MESSDPRGQKAPKKVDRRKRHILTGTLCLMIEVEAYTADTPDRDCGPVVLKHIRGRLPFLSHVFADGGYARQKFANPHAKTGNWSIEITKRSAGGLIRKFETLNFMR